MPKKLTAHEAALAALVPADERDEFERGVRVFVARNQLLELIETQRIEEHLTKQALAEKAGLDPASVRRLLTAETGNPTTETAVRLLSALKIKLVAVLPSGDEIPIGT
jgi:DNA-binding phage protein